MDETCHDVTCAQSLLQSKVSHDAVFQTRDSTSIVCSQNLCRVRIQVLAKFIGCTVGPGCDLLFSWLLVLEREAIPEEY